MMKRNQHSNQVPNKEDKNAMFFSKRPDLNIEMISGSIEESETFLKLVGELLVDYSVKYTIKTR